jgi:melibiase-like protein
MLRLGAAAGALLASAALARAAEVPVIARHGDAYVSHQGGSDLWSIGSTNLELAIGFDAAGTLVPRRLTNLATGRVWTLAPQPDVTLTIGGEPIVFTSGGALSFSSAAAADDGAGVVLTFVFDHRASRARITRSYAAYPGSPTVETWTRVESPGQPIDVTNLTGWQLAMTPALVRWLGGLRGDSADTEQAGAFALDEWDMEPGDRLEIGSERLSTEQFVPFLLVDDGRDQLFGGIMWSAAWRIACERKSDTLEIRAFFPNVATSVTPQQPLDVPHAFFGLRPSSAGDESGALQQFIVNGIRRGRPFQPLVTYNTWYAYGTTIDEDAAVAEIDRAAALGAELFVLDAGWWAGAGANGDYDFDSGLGQWTEDPDRFPSTLASLADYAHGLGLRFGLWIEPARIALSLVDKPGLAREAWLATAGGGYGAPANAQICLARVEAHQWLLDQIAALIARVRPDYLKWDENFWINCDRSGHGHGASDGAFAHTRALYDILGALRRRFPDLMVENVAGGGNRLDFGMVGLSDVAWMDDRTSPAVHVRHNIEGLTIALPPAYLLSFVIDGAGEPIAGSDDLRLVTRSRMPGVLGLTYRSANVGDDTGADLAQQIQEYKAIRDIVTSATAALLSAQAPGDGQEWDVLQELTSDGARGLIFAFKATRDEGRVLVRPRGLRASAVYDVRSLDGGSIGSATGGSLMQDGIEIVHAGASRAHVLVFAAR